MKKITLTIVALVIGFAMTSCDSTSPKEKIMKSVDEFFVQAEQNVQKVASGEEFMSYFADFATQKTKFIENLFGPYADKDGNITGISDSDMEEIQSYIYDRATAYNKVEAEKAKEFMGPELDIIENYVNELYAQFQAGNELDKETVKNFDDAYVNFLKKYKDYDNVLPELQKRRDAIWGKMDEMNEVLIAKLKEIYPEQ